MFLDDATPTQKVVALGAWDDAAPTLKLRALRTPSPSDEAFPGLTLSGGETLKDARGLFLGQYALHGTQAGLPVEFHLDERTSTVTLQSGLRVRELSSREVAALRRRVQAYLDETPRGDFAASTFLVHLNEAVYGRPVLAHFEPTVACEKPLEGLTLSGRVGKASLDLHLSRAGRLTLTWRPRGCETSRSRRLSSTESATLAQVLGARLAGEPRTLLDEAVARVWEAARGGLH